MSNEELIVLYQSGDESALTQLVEQNKKLVKFLCNRLYSMISNTLLDFDDLEQEAWIEFMKSAKKFKDDAGFKFTSFAGKNIRFSLLTFINRRGYERKYKNDTSSERVHIASMDETVSGLDGVSIADTIQDEAAENAFIAVDDEIDKEILHKDLIDLLDSVFGRENKYNGYDFSGCDNVVSLFQKLSEGVNGKEVLTLHYGLDGQQTPFRAIGERYRVSASRVQQIHNEALRSIRCSSEGKRFKEKYQYALLASIEDKRDSVNQFQDAAKVINQMESIDEMLEAVLKACGA